MKGNLLAASFVILAVLVSGCASILDSTNPQNMNSVLAQDQNSVYTVNYSTAYGSEADFLATHNLTKYNRNGQVVVEHRTYYKLPDPFGGTSTERLYDPGNTSIKCEIIDGEQTDCRESPGTLQGDFLINSGELKNYTRNFTYVKERDILNRTCSLFSINMTEEGESSFSEDPSTNVCVDQDLGYVAYAQVNHTILGQRTLGFEYRATGVEESVPEDIELQYDE